MFKKRETYTDWLTPASVELVKLETPAEHLARVHEKFLEQKLLMGTKHLLHPKNRVRRLDGKSYAKEKPTNVQPLKRKIAA
jgi:hypothetical protein